jgi:hypothetical protein
MSIAVTPVCRRGMAAISPLSDRASTAPNGLFNGLIWPNAGFASIAYDATAASNFLPLPAAPPFLARQESPPWCGSASANDPAPAGQRHTHICRGRARPSSTNLSNHRS